MSEPRRMRIEPTAYLDSLVKRGRQIQGVVRMTVDVYGGPGRRNANLVVTYAPESPHVHQVNAELREAVDALRREFSSAFPEWGISCEWRPYFPVKVKPVVRSYILGDHVWQDLACGHKVKLIRLKVKRHCNDCTSEDAE